MSLLNLGETSFRDVKFKVTLFNKEIFVKSLLINNTINTIPTISLEMAPSSITDPDVDKKGNRLGLLGSLSAGNESNKVINIGLDTLRIEAKYLQNKIFNQALDYSQFDIESAVSSSGSDIINQLKHITGVESDNLEDLLDTLKGGNLLLYPDPEDDSKVMRFMVTKPVINISNNSVGVTLNGIHVVALLNNVKFNLYTQPQFTAITGDANSVLLEELRNDIITKPNNEVTLNYLLKFVYKDFKTREINYNKQLTKEDGSVFTKSSIKGIKSQLITNSIFSSYFLDIIEDNLSDDKSQLFGIEELLTEIPLDDSTRVQTFIGLVKGLEVLLTKSSAGLIDTLLLDVLPLFYMTFRVDLVTGRIILEKNQVYKEAQTFITTENGEELQTSVTQEHSNDIINKDVVIKQLNYSLAPTTQLPVNQVSIITSMNHGSLTALAGIGIENDILATYPTIPVKIGRSVNADPPLYGMTIINNRAMSRTLNTFVGSETSNAIIINRADTSLPDVKMSVDDIITNLEKEKKASTTAVLQVMKFLTTWAKTVYNELSLKYNTATLTTTFDLDWQPGRIYQLYDNEKFICQAYLEGVTHTLSINRSSGSIESRCLFRYVRTLFKDNETTELGFLDTITELFNVNNLLADISSAVGAVVSSIKGKVGSFLNNFKLPSISLPSLKLPNFKLPDFPSFTLPDFPSLTLPDFPSFTLPNVASIGRAINDGITNTIGGITDIFSDVIGGVSGVISNIHEDLSDILDVDAIGDKINGLIPDLDLGDLNLTDNAIARTITQSAQNIYDSTLSPEALHQLTLDSVSLALKQQSLSSVKTALTTKVDSHFRGNVQNELTRQKQELTNTINGEISIALVDKHEESIINGLLTTVQGELNTRVSTNVTSVVDKIIPTI